MAACTFGAHPEGIDNPPIRRVTFYADEDAEQITVAACDLCYENIADQYGILTEEPIRVVRCEVCSDAPGTGNVATVLVSGTFRGYHGWVSTEARLCDACATRHIASAHGVCTEVRAAVIGEQYAPVYYVAGRGGADGIDPSTNLVAYTHADAAAVNATAPDYIGRCSDGAEIEWLPEWDNAAVAIGHLPAPTDPAPVDLDFPTEFEVTQCAAADDDSDRCNAAASHTYTDEHGDNRFPLCNRHAANLEHFTRIGIVGGSVLAGIRRDTDR